MQVSPERPTGGYHSRNLGRRRVEKLDFLVYRDSAGGARASYRPVMRASHRPSA